MFSGMNKQVNNPSIPFVMTVPSGPLQAGHVILLQGNPLQYANRFCFNLIRQSDMKCAFHIDFRFDQNQTVRNCELPSGWGSEERSHLPVAKGLNFQCEMRIMNDRILVAVDGRHFCEFAHRVPVTSADTLQIQGDVRITKILFKKEHSYPSYPSCPSYPSPPATGQLNIENPRIPFVHLLNGGLRDGGELFIQGKVKPRVNRFHVNLQQGKQTYPHPTIAFHFNPRFDSGPPVIVMNSYIGNWGNEERPTQAVPFRPNMDFVLEIKRRSYGYEVVVNGSMVAVYNHRINPDIVDSVAIDGDVIIHRVMSL